MPKVFFMSYARPRSNRGGPDAQADESQHALIDRFYEALRKHVQGQIPGGDQLPVAFRDARNIEAGTTQWASELSAQLREYPIGLVLLAPAYLDQDRPWCRWECKYFEERNLAASNVSGALQAETPRLLLVVEWIKPFENDVPIDFPSQTQRVGESIAHGNAAHAEEVRHILREGLMNVQELAEAGTSTARTSWMAFIQLLGNEIVEQWRRWQAIDPRKRVNPAPPSFDPRLQWTPAQATNAGGQAKARPDRSQRRMVYVVYVAAKPRDVSPHRAWRYEDLGESDWRPFAGLTPQGDDEPVDAYLEALEGVKVEKWPLTYFKDNMAELLAEIKDRSPVLFVVDPWTATQLDNYGGALIAYARAMSTYETFGVPVVVWNENDTESMGLRRDFAQRIESLFAGNIVEPVSQGDELRTCLITVVAGLQRKIRHKLAGNLPSNGSPPPRISPT